MDALHFLLKPISTNEIDYCLKKAWNRIKVKKYANMAITVKGPNGLERVAVSEIIFCTVLSHYVDVVTRSAVYTYKKTIREMAAELPKEFFFQAHRSFLVNISHVRGFDGEAVLMDNEVRVPVARKKRSDLRKRMLNTI